MKWLISILFPVICFSQEQIDTCFTVSELEDISYTLDSLINQNKINEQIISEQKSIITDLETVIKLDSLNIKYTEQQNAYLRDNVLFLNKQVELLQPKWYNHKSIYFVAGILTTAITSKFIIEVTK